MSSSESSGPGHIVGALNNETLIDAEKAKKIIKNIGSEAASKMSDKEKEAFQKYTGTAYVNINATLRGIDKSFEVGNRENAKNLHAVLENASLPCESTVYRGMSSKALGNLNKISDNELVGKIFWDKGFLSTSLESSSAFGGDVLLEIHAPAGSHGLYVGYVSSAGHYEEEVLFDMNQSMRIDSVTHDNFGRKLLKVTII